MKKNVSVLLMFMFINVIGLWAQDPVKVLFIGNSYTSANDLPGTFRQLAAGMGRDVTTSSVNPGGYTFNQHSVYAATLTAIQSAKWDYVILQEQSQLPSFPPSQVTVEVFPYARKLDSLIRLNDSCTETVFYMTWGRKNGDASNCASWPPVCTYAGMQEQLRKNYLQMGADNSAVVAPVGMAWNATIQESPLFDLWSSDESHPSLHGTYLTACVFYATLFHESPAGSTFQSALSPQDAEYLQEMAAKTVFDSLYLWAGSGDKAYALFNAQINNLNVSFTNTSLNADSWSWDFGDGNTSLDEDAVHDYAAYGHYPVKLMVQNACSADTLSDTLHLSNASVGVMSPELSTWTLQPNPCKDFLMISGMQDAQTIYYLYDARGRLLLQATSTGSEPLTIGVHTLKPGLYFLRATGISGTQTRPFLKE